MMTERPAEKMTVLKLQQMKKEKKPVDVDITVGSKLNGLQPTTNVLV